ncbi:zinc finger and BTB domain-containing protein 40 isoform X1 [Corythoichthys intestinalis]|uniref:zinc finger and BTB domain-containing protein 40 isoform X1 n=2 Tax=Corythoichthys intestinalis TaxID=161448 RepID=UPI0025A4D911|nr:zinc finger and BTB domain-containing protein 40 isoform X1 [Corythoichthys intestinalis]XP_057700978.1 zinc finger and BTB domain-containing protein 40 isoform X1 [Corythoichthys intestinalis]
MIELPNYSSQLMQQLWALRKEGHLCDCTVLVGDYPHRAHKLVLAASSMLFRSLLDLSDTVAIDTSLVSSQEFSCLLDMVYTGKLPLGKHNVSRIIAAADNLQMFDVAVSFKTVLANVINQQTSGSTSSTQTQTLKPVLKLYTPEVSVDSPSNDKPTEGGIQAKDMSDENRCEDANENSNEPPCKRVCPEFLESSGPKEKYHSESVVEKDDATTASTESIEEEKNATITKTAHLELTSKLTEKLTSVPDVVQLLKQSAHSALDEQERELVYNCCKADPSSIVRKLLNQVEKGLVSEQALMKLLHTVQQSAPSNAVSQPSQLEALEKDTQALDGQQTGGNAAELLSGPEQERSSGTEVKLETSNITEPEVQDKDIYSQTTKSYCCRWCERTFAYKCRVLAHTKRCPMSKECRVQCPHCPAKLVSQRAFKGHLAEAHPDAAVDKKKKKVACDLCGRTFAHPSGLIYHKRTEHFDEKPYACETCGAKFPATSSLKNHMRLHTGEKPYQCKHCDMSFAVAAALAYHTKKKHSEGKMYVCQYCKAVFAQSIELTRHVRTHTGDKPYVCRECGKGHSQASGLTTHLQTSHNMLQPLNCQKCCLSFQTLDEMQKHIEELHLKVCHKCPTCSKVFTCASLLEKHKSVHTGMKPFICTLCDKSYQQLSGLWYHNRTNHPEVFANQTRQLKTLVQCDICFRFFPCASSLAKHMENEHKDGSTESTMHCPHCNVVFGGSEELQEHVCSQHAASGNSFICPLCSQVSTSNQELQEHLLSCHMESQLTKEEADKERVSSVHTVISVHQADGETAQSITSDEQSRMAVTQQVLVALTEEREGGNPGEVLEVNMYDLLDNSVTTFVCEEKKT